MFYIIPVLLAAFLCVNTVKAVLKTTCIVENGHLIGHLIGVP